MPRPFEVANRRLQVLLDEEQFEHLERLARRRNTSVAALVRHALDRVYPRSQIPREEAGERLLSRPPLDLGDWEEAKRVVEEGMSRGLSG